MFLLYVWLYGKACSGHLASTDWLCIFTIKGLSGKASLPVHILDLFVIGQRV